MLLQNVDEVNRARPGLMDSDFEWSEFEPPLYSNPHCTYFQDKADSYDPDHTEDTIHLSEEDMSAFIPLTFNTSVDLRQKLRVRNLIPPSQFQPKSPNRPKSPNNQKLPKSQSFGEEKALVPKRAKLGGVGPAGDHKVPSLGNVSGKASL